MHATAHYLKYVLIIAPFIAKINRKGEFFIGKCAFLRFSQKTLCDIAV